MSQAPFQCIENLRIGTVDYVSPTEIRVLLDIEAPESVALNTGAPRPFPRVNGYVLLPVDDCYVVGQVEWLTVERSAFPKRRGMQDFGLIDLPYPLRKMSVNPLGTLRKEQNELLKDEAYCFGRGAEALPSIGCAVLLPTEIQLRSIVESGENRRIKIGTSPLASNADVCIDPDRLFGRHLAVLGNTGSGKSCSVAGLVHWCLEQAQAKAGGPPNARFVILDPNGEYAKSFAALQEQGEAAIFKVSPSQDEAAALQIPLWFWNSAEWCSFTQASAKVQRPLLRRALREVKAGKTYADGTVEEEGKLRTKRYLVSTMISLQKDVKSGAISSDASKFGHRLKVASEDLETLHNSCPECKIAEVTQKINQALSATYKTFIKDGQKVEYYSPFSLQQADAIVAAFAKALEDLGGISYEEGLDEDIPVRFDGPAFADHLQVIAEQENVSQFVDLLVSRIRTFLADKRMKSVLSDNGTITLEGWLESYVGAENSPVSVRVLDLSLVPSEVIHVVTAVIARVLFEALQRYRKINTVALPTVLVMEEAHTFIKRYKEEAENQDAATVCCQVFERIAREGRKFGLGLVLSSQRPSELSQTVLSQCNSFLLHRISNDRDQELVHRMVPDNLKGLLSELPSLPSQNAILMGWASELPILVRMNHLDKSKRPSSDDPDFWNVWTGKDEHGDTVKRPIDWKPIVNDWQGTKD